MKKEEKFNKSDKTFIDNHLIVYVINIKRVLHMLIIVIVIGVVKVIKQHAIQLDLKIKLVLHLLDKVESEHVCIKVYAWKYGIKRWLVH